VGIEICNEIQWNGVFIEKFERRTMKVNRGAARPANASGWMLITCWLTFTLLKPGLMLEAQSSDTKNSNAQSDAEVYKTIHLYNLSQQDGFGELQICLHNLLPKIKIDSLSSQGALSIRGSAKDVAMAEKIVADFDKPRATYRLSFTLTGADNGKGAEAQTFSLIAGSGEKTELKQGRRVPIISGQYDAGSSTQDTHVQDQDVGLNIEVTVDGIGDGVRLRSKLEQSSLSDEKSGAGAQDPIFQQAVLECTTKLALGKTQVLGSLGNGHKQEVSVVAERVN
jgi:type II secretory pathway component GspD/PulD (secretin)